MRRSAPIVLALVVIVGAYVTRELRLNAVYQYRESQRYADIYYLPPANWLPVLSFGFRAALADLIWCRSLVYFGEEMVQHGSIKFAFDYTDAVLALDPDFRSAYAWIATVAAYRPAASAYEDGWKASTYLKRALQRWPNDGDLHWRYGALLRFELSPLLPEGAKKQHIHALAAPHLSAAASLGAGPAWIGLNSASLLERLGKKEQAIRQLEEVYGTVQDDFTKHAIEERLGALRSEAFVEALRTANTEFEQARRASFPYLSGSMFLLVGPKQAELRREQMRNRFLAPVPNIDEDQANELP